MTRGREHSSVATLLHEMARRDARYGLETMCMSSSQVLAAVFDRADEWV